MLIIEFKSQKEWRTWLSKNHRSSDGIWMRIYKKDSGQVTIYYPAALDEALCFGWIDGQKKSHDDKSFLQRFTPRRARSIWSKINIGHVARLTAAGKMMPAGLEQVEKAKADGRWAQAYDSPRAATVPEDFLKELRKSKKAEAFFKTLRKSQLYSITWRIQTAKKPETRARRIELIVKMLARGETF